MSGDKNFSANAGFRYKDMYYEIIKIAKTMPAFRVRQLLGAWDKYVIDILLQLDTTNFPKGDFHVNPHR